MKISKDGKVKQATKDELWSIWYKRGLYDCGYDFNTYLEHCKKCGVKIVN